MRWLIGDIHMGPTMAAIDMLALLERARIQDRGDPLGASPAIAGALRWLE